MANNNRRSGTGRHERAERETVQTNFDDVIAVTETTADKALNGNREEQFTVGYDRLSFSLKFVAPGIALFLLVRFLEKSPPLYLLIFQGFVRFSHKTLILLESCNIF